MPVDHLTAAEWNARVRAYGGTFLQSWEWGDLQKHIGKTVHRYVGAEYIATAVEQPLPRGFFYRYFPHGPLFKNSNNVSAWQVFLKEVRQNAPRELFLKCEPRYANTPDNRAFMHALGFRAGGMVQPQVTRMINLTSGKEHILASMEHRARYGIRTAERRGVSILEARTLEEKRAHFDIFWNIFETTNTRHKLSRYTENYYRAIIDLTGSVSSRLFFAMYKGEAVATALIIYFGTDVYYLFAGSKKGFSRLNAPTCIVWSVVERAQQEGYKMFDLWGISYDDKAWAGITAFKKSFGGTELNTIGAWDMPQRKMLYNTYKFLKHFV